MQDTAGLRYLLKRRRGEPNGADPFAFGFDGVNDYISSPTIGRTGNNMNVSGNVTTGSDGDGDYFGFTLTPQSLLATTTVMSALTLASAFSYAIKIKTGSDVTTTQIVHNNVISASNRVTLSIASGELRVGIYNGTSYVGKKSFSVTTNTTYVIHYTRDGSSVGKLYLAGVEQTNVPTGDPTSSGTVGFSLSNAGSGFLGQVYFFAGWNKALTKSEIDADIALGNTTKQDPSIVAYYVPENLQYNTQYLTNPTALDQSNWIKTGTTSVTANTTVAPDGTTTADTVTIAGTATQGCTTVVTSITGSNMAGKTFIVKAFVKVSAGTDQFRLQCSHNGVADYYSGNLTATTDRQEFTFTQTFTSSTSGTGITAGLINDGGAGGATIQVRNVRLYLINQTLRDESPNIGGFIGRKTNTVLSVWIKPGADAVNNGDSQSIIQIPYLYIHLRDTINLINVRTDTRQAARAPGTMALGNGYRGKVHIIGYKYRDGSVWRMKLYINGVLQLGTQTVITVDPAVTIYGTVAWCGRRNGTYYNGNIRDARIYTLTDSFTDSDAMAIYNGGEPISPGITKYLHYKPPVGEVGTTTQDQSPNDRDGTLNGGVTRDYI